jgi:hypothetical protein
MKAKDVDNITSNEAAVRLRIYDGDLQISEAAQELIRMERARADALEHRLNAVQTRAAQNLLTSPAPFCPRPGEIGFKE